MTFCVFMFFWNHKNESMLQSLTISLMQNRRCNVVNEMLYFFSSVNGHHTPSNSSFCIGWLAGAGWSWLTFGTLTLAKSYTHLPERRELLSVTPRMINTTLLLPCGAAAASFSYKHALVTPRRCSSGPLGLRHHLHKQ